MKSMIERDIESTIRLLRFMTWHEGSIYLSMFNANTFQEASVTSYLERSGLCIKDKKFYSPKDLKEFLLRATNPFRFPDDEVLAAYKRQRWNEE